MWRVSLITAAALAIFWTIWSWQVGPVPQITRFNIDNGRGFNFAHSISRWGDLIFVWFLTVISVLSLTVLSASPKKFPEGKPLNCLISSAILGVLISIPLFNNRLCLGSGHGLIIASVIAIAYGSTSHNYMSVFTFSSLTALITGAVAGSVQGTAFLVVFNAFGLSAYGLRLLAINHRLIAKSCCKWFWPTSA
jgi:hypothetical protein